MDNIAGRTDFKNSIINYIRSGETKSKNLGLEIEHFIIDKDGKQISYEQITKLIEDVANEIGAHIVYTDGYPVGYYTEEYGTSLEPSCQFEISINPYNDIDKIKKIYNDFIDLWKPIFKKIGYKFERKGNLPLVELGVVTPDDIKLSHKKRYKYMDAYFKNSGQYGSYMMRASASTQVSVDYKNDIKIGNNIANQLSEIFKKTRNTARFLMGNLFDFDPKADYVEYDKLETIDKFALSRLAKLIKNVDSAFQGYEFYKYFQQLQNFASVDLSSFYLDIVKDNLGKKNYLKSNLENQKMVTTYALAFETLCLNHINQIKNKLNIAWMSTNDTSWIEKGDQNKRGAQIDILIERKDNVLNLCEINFFSSEVAITKDMHLNLMNKRETLKNHIKKKTSIQNVLVTTYGLKKNEYYQNIHYNS